MRSRLLRQYSQNLILLGPEADSTRWKELSVTAELEVAIRAARAGGEVLRRSYGALDSVRYKGPVDLVTEADEESERVVTSILLDGYPDYGIHAEESGRREGTADARWIIDPLDGTTNYAHGFPFFAVSIALQKAGQVTAGVVYNPVMEELFVAERGSGATLNGKPLQVSATTELSRALLATGFPYDRSEAPPALRLWDELTMLTQGMRRAGSAALDVCYVAAGRLDGYFERGIHAWDVAAGSLILEEAGGTVTDYHGRTLDLEGREIVASNGPLHAPILAVTRR